MKTQRGSRGPEGAFPAGMEPAETVVAEPEGEDTADASDAAPPKPPVKLNALWRAGVSRYKLLLKLENI